ncbi:MAG: sulfite exporter TauE/SafE family protein [Bacillota bacterium]
MNTILFFIVVFLSYTMQGITGFAGTILAMPFSISLMGYEIAKPVLNAVGFFSGLYIVVIHSSYVNWQEVKKMIFYMLQGIVLGLLVYHIQLVQVDFLYIILIVFIFYIGLKGLFIKGTNKEYSKTMTRILLIFAGLIHSFFATGGPLVIGYMTNKTKDKDVFRATLSAVWMFLNGFILGSDIINGVFTTDLITLTAIVVPILFFSMWIGGKIYRYIDQALFMKITYIVLILIGIFMIAT